MLIINVHIFYFWYSKFWNSATARMEGSVCRIGPMGHMLLVKGLYGQQEHHQCLLIMVSLISGRGKKKKNKHPRLVLIQKHDSGRLTAEPRAELLSEKHRKRRHFSQDLSSVTTVINPGCITLEYKYHPLVLWTSGARETFSNSIIFVSCVRKHPECSKS